MPPEERQRLYRKIDFVRYAPTTPDSPEAVERRLEEAAAMGWHQSNTEYTPHLAGVALRLPGSDRQPSMVVVGPASRRLGRPAETAAIAQPTPAQLRQATNLSLSTPLSIR